MEMNEMDWDQILSDAGLTKREVDAISTIKKPNLKASEIAKDSGPLD